MARQMDELQISRILIHLYIYIRTQNPSWSSFPSSLPFPLSRFLHCCHVASPSSHGQALIMLRINTATPPPPPFIIQKSTCEEGLTRLMRLNPTTPTSSRRCSYSFLPTCDWHHLSRLPEPSRCRQPGYDSFPGRLSLVEWWRQHSRHTHGTQASSSYS